MLDPKSPVPTEILQLASGALSSEEQQSILVFQHAILEMVVRECDEQDILDQLCSMAEGLLPNSVASIMMKQANDHLDVLSAPSVPSEGVALLNGLVPGPEGGSCGNAVYHNEPQFVVDVAVDPRCGDTREVLQEFGLCACWSMPIRNAESEAIGSFALSSFEIREPTDFHKQLLAIGANIVGIILQRSSQRRQLEFMAYNDPLTELTNRLSLFEKVEAAILQSQDTHSGFALMYLDLNRFKNLNDTFGHVIGDEVLIRVARRLKAEVREEDTLARIGGDEFVLLIEHIGSAAVAKQRAEALLETLQDPVEYEGHNFAIGGSIGVALYPQDGDKVETLLKHADTAMYQAKRYGGSSVCFYEASLSEKAERAFVLENDLNAAIKKDEFDLFFQAQVDGETFTVMALRR